MLKVGVIKKEEGDKYDVLKFDIEPVAPAQLSQETWVRLPDGTFRKYDELAFQDIVQLAERVRQQDNSEIAEEIADVEDQSSI